MSFRCLENDVVMRIHKNPEADALLHNPPPNCCNCCCCRIGPTGPIVIAGTIIPFATGRAVQTSTTGGAPSEGAAIGYGNAIQQPLVNDAPITSALPLAFDVPYNAVLRSIRASAAPATDLDLGDTVRPFIRLYAAPAGSNVFSPLAICEIEPFLGGTQYPASTTHTGSATGLAIKVEAGTRIMIIGSIRADNSLTTSLSMVYTGAIELAPVM